MPPGVRFDGYRYILRSNLTSGREVRLCAASATRAQVWTIYESFTCHPDDQLNAICCEYMSSPQFTKLAVSTRNQYKVCYTGLSKITFNKGSRLMALSPAKITPGILQQILDIRIAEGKPVQGNREIKGFLSAIFSWALARDRIPGLQGNPCHSVKRNHEKARTHYVEDWELELAQQQASRELRIFMELAYLLYARSEEVLNLERKNLLDDGVLVDRIKGSSSNIVRWSPRLLKVVDDCKATSVLSPHLLTKDDGMRITYSMLKKPWTRLMETCVKINPDFRFFTRHDLKRKGITDQILEQNSAGHKTEAMRQRYKVKPDQVEPAR